MENFLELLIQAIVPILATVVTAAVAYLTAKIKQKTAVEIEKINDETKRTIAEKVVAYVEQTAKEMANTEKFQLAIDKASEWLKEKNIPVTETELTILVESAVNGLHKGLETKTTEYIAVEESAGIPAPDEAEVVVTEETSEKESK